MRKLMTLSCIIILVHLSLSIWMMIGSITAYASDFDEVENILGFPGQIQEGTFVVRFPRSDIKVKIDGEPMPTTLGFVSWTAWKDMGTGSMMMGDLVLLEKEINSVISTLAVANISVTGLHNHFIGEDPRIMYMHIYGIGPKAALAHGVLSALEKTATPKSHPETAIPSQSVLTLDTKRIEEIIGHSGQVGGGVFKITLGRPGVKMGGIQITSSIGLNTWAAFVGTNERAHVAGDVAMTAKEVNRVIRALRRGGIDIVAVHNHMLDEKPRIFFLHYWGTGPAEKLAETLREAFDQAKGSVRNASQLLGALFTNFDADETGKIDRGFTNEVGEWKVIADPNALSKPNVLAQLAKNSGSIFNIALISGTNYKDVDISVKMKAIAGKEDQGGGLVWRAKNAKNYYVVRYNPLEDNYRIYKVEKGRRIQLQSADIKHSEGWHTLRVTMEGDHIQCYYDGKKYLDVKDSTFQEAGKIGLWTKADAQSHFDDLTVSGK